MTAAQNVYHSARQYDAIAGDDVYGLAFVFPEFDQTPASGIKTLFRSRVATTQARSRIAQQQFRSRTATLERPSR
jgi:hypothetical protein